MAWLLSLKVFFISTGVIFTALGLKVSVPLFSELAATHVPAVWNFCLLCLKPPYLYVLINGIIIYIAASSRFNGAVEDHTEEPIPLPKAVPVVPAYEVKSPPDLAISEFEPRDQEPPVLEVKAVVVNGSVPVEEEGIDHGMTSLKRMDSSEIPLDWLSTTEKPLVSARFGHRRPPRFTPDGGRSLRVAKQPKRHDTLENTWKMITEGRAMPLSRHMKKCDTWENRGPHDVKKSETFKERVNQAASTAPMKLRKEPSLSQDELNRRVEAFIRKFNEEMRLQRQESLNQLMEMIDRGSH